MKLNAARSNGKQEEGRDAGISKIAQVFLPDDRKEFSPEYLKRKKIMNLAGYSLLGLLIFCLILFILSSNRVQIAVTVSKIAQKGAESRQKAILEDYKLKLKLINPAIAKCYLSGAYSVHSKIEGGRILLVNKQSGSPAMANIVFNRPIDLSSGYFLLDARSLNDAGRVKVVLKDDRSVSNARRARSIIIEKNNRARKGILIKPDAGDTAIDLGRISEIRFEAEPLYPTAKAQASVLIEDFSYLTKQQVSED